MTLFFSLSGFLLSQPFVAAALSGSPFPKIGTYFRNRALRILPAWPPSPRATAQAGC
jgi:peptidoglycan/LPS O-acetylase OafA/YrhL